MTQTVLITGASKGIGLELAIYYKNQGADVIAVCRVNSDQLQALDIEVIEGIDVSSGEDVTRLSQSLVGRSIDVLINNAGIFDCETLSDMDFTQILRQFEVNAMGALRVTQALQSELPCGAKVALITSRMGSINDNTSGAYYGYRMSKAALNAAGMSLAHDLKPHGISVAIVHPGFVQTSMVGYAGDISPQTAAERIAERIDALTLENSGTFWHSNGEVLPW